jgi:alpha-D-xyloside xylohydrolase
VLQAGDATLTVSSDARTITLARAGTTLLRFPADGFSVGTVGALQGELAYDPYWLEKADALAGPFPQDLAFEDFTQASVTRAGGTLEMRHTFSGGTQTLLVLAADAAGRFSAHWSVTSPGPRTVVAMMRLRARASDTEGFYGLGEWPDDVNHRGKLRPMQMEVDLSSESANIENHVPVPLLLGTSGWGLFVKSRRVGLFDVARKEPTLVEVTYGTAEDSAQGLDIYLMADAEPLTLTRHYYDVTSPPTLPAPWALGPWIWRDENRDQAEVEDDIRQIRDLDLATSAIWIDRPYSSGVNTFDFKASQFPDPAAMVATSHAAGLRLALWSVPYVGADAEPYRGQAQSMGYLAPSHGALLNSWGVPVDFTNAAAMDWWQALVSRYTDLGVEGFKLDYAEDVVPSLYHARNGWSFSDGSDERTMHHGYTPLYHRAYAERLPAGGGFLLCRSGRWGGQKYASVIWPGDLDATFTRHGEPFTNREGQVVAHGVGGLPASVVMGVGLGPSGYPFFGADTGGYRHSPPSKELFIRWVEQTALSSVMQVGDSSSQPPWVFTAENGRDVEALNTYRTYARLHLRLFPYEWTVAQQVASTGRPIQRPLGLAYPQLGSHPNDEYMFGPDLLVAPVLEDLARSRSVTFPAGDWVDWWTGEKITGPLTRSVDAPLGTLPIYLRAGGVVAMLRPTIDTLAPATLAGVESYANDPGVLTVRMFAGAQPTSSALFDGTSFSLARVEGGGLDISTSSGTTFTQGAVLEVVQATMPAAITLDGAPLAPLADMAAVQASPAAGWAFASGVLWVRVTGGAHTLRVR